MRKFISFTLVFLTTPFIFADPTFQCEANYSSVFDLVKHSDKAEFELSPDQLKEQKASLVNKSAWQLRAEFYSQPGTNDMRVLFKAKNSSQKDQTNLTLSLYDKNAKTHEGIAFHERKQTEESGSVKHRLGRLHICCKIKITHEKQKLAEQSAKISSEVK